MPPADFYHTLGVKREASLDEIKKAYRRLARLYHPDANKGDKGKESKFKEMNEAYEVLSDPQKRQAYDQFGHASTQGGGAGAGAGFGGFGGFGQGAAGFDFSQFNMGGQWGDIFEGFFGGNRGAAGRGASGGSRGAAGPRRGQDIEINLNLTFDEAVFGCERNFKLTAPASCEACHGQGHPAGTKLKRCHTCEGQGQVRRLQQSVFGQIMQAMICEDCEGAGEVPEKTCPTCHGRGRVRAERPVHAKIPAGVDTGSAVRITGHGEAGLKGGPAGDLYIHIAVAPSAKFQRQGHDIHTELHLVIPQAALGDELEVETIHGAVTLKVPAGIASGKLLRLRGKGVPVPNSSKVGDHLVHVLIDIPQRLSKAETELYAKLAKEAGLKLKPQAKGNWFKDIVG